MGTKDLRPYLKDQWERIRTELVSGTYELQPVRRVEIPKPQGGKRLLGIPTVLDRLIQQALSQVLNPIFDPGFSPSSYGLRPGKRAQDAVRAAQGYIEAGYKWFSFLPGKQVRIRLASKTKERVAAKIREITSRTQPLTMAERIRKLNAYLGGWLAYFRLAQTPSVYEQLDEWTRRRLRMCLWKQWKRAKTRYRELRRLGLKPSVARDIAGTQAGYWRAAATPQLHKALGLAYWQGQGLVSLKERYGHRFGTAVLAVVERQPTWHPRSRPLSQSPPAQRCPTCAWSLKGRSIGWKYGSSSRTDKIPSGNDPRRPVDHSKPDQSQYQSDHAPTVNSTMETRNLLAYKRLPICARKRTFPVRTVVPSQPIGRTYEQGLSRPWDDRGLM